MKKLINIRNLHILQEVLLCPNCQKQWDGINCTNPNCESNKPINS